MAIIRTGHVVENSASGDHVIGIRWFDDTGGDGSVTVTPTSDYLLESEQAGWNNVMVGGYFGTGLLSVDGDGATATVRAPSSPTGETRVTVGADANFDGGGSGRIEALNGGIFRMTGNAGTGIGRLEIAPVFGVGSAMADGGTISLSGFGEAHVDIGTMSGTGSMTLQNGGQLSMVGNGASHLTIGPDGDGTLSIQAGSRADLGGAGTLLVGGAGTEGSFTQGIVRVEGAGAELTGIGTAWIGSDPSIVTTTPYSSGRIYLNTGGSLGNVGAVFNIGVMGELETGTGSVTGRLNLAGGTINMMPDARDTLTINGDLVGTQGSSWIMMGGGAPGVPMGGDFIRINGEFRVEGDANVTIELLGEAGYRFLAGDHLVMMEADNFNLGTPGVGATAHVHAGWNVNFGYVFSVSSTPTLDNTELLEFDALTDMDATETTAILSLDGGTTGATVTISGAPIGGLTNFNIAGGRYEWAVANGLAGLIGTAFGDDFQLQQVLTNFSVSAAGGNDVINAGSGNDRLFGGDGNDTIYGNDGADYIGGGNGNDAIDGGSGQNTMFGGYGNDTINGGSDTDLIYGSTGRNRLFGNDGGDFIQAGNGGDFIGGGAGNDTVRGGDAADTIYGGAGNDNLAGGAGNDVIYGSAGSNVIYAGLGNDTVQGGNGSDTIVGSGGRNALLGNDGNDVIYTSAGGDFVGGGAGNDTVRGSSGNDTIYAGTGNDNIGGGAGNDVIYLSAGTNVLWAGTGDDTVNAGVGRDIMSGGPGADVFVFASAASIGIGGNRDVITDFVAGVDQIDLTALGQTFNGAAGLIGGGAASFYYFAPSGLLIGDQNGDGVADWVLELTGSPAVTAGDFLL